MAEAQTEPIILKSKPTLQQLHLGLQLPALGHSEFPLSQPPALGTFAEAAPGHEHCWTAGGSPAARAEVSALDGRHFKKGQEASNA